MPEHPDRIHIFVDHQKIEFETNHVTGREIKERANVPLEHDLAWKVGPNLELVTNEQTIIIKVGDHFYVLPPGSIS